MQTDLAKCILQGGWMVSAGNYGLPKTVLNNSPFYITTNNLPNFGKEEYDSVKRRIEIFTTMSLPQTLPGIDKWIYDHEMDCIAWIAEKINANREHIDRHELWYEPNHSGPLTIVKTGGGVYLVMNTCDAYPMLICARRTLVSLRNCRKQSTTVLRRSYVRDVSRGREEPLVGS
jgi:hypothetical protein